MHIIAERSEAYYNHDVTSTLIRQILKKTVRKCGPLIGCNLSSRNKHIPSNAVVHVMCVCRFLDWTLEPHHAMVAILEAFAVRFHELIVLVPPEKPTLSKLTS